MKNFVVNDIKNIRGMVFGVFDNLHPGHEFFLLEAAKDCDELVVVVTLPEIVSLLKGKTPKKSLEERIGDIRDFFADKKILSRTGVELEFFVVAGDKEIGSWNILKQYKPDVIFLGYDQQAIARELDKLKALVLPKLEATSFGVFSYKFIESYEPEKYKSSLRK